MLVAQTGSHQLRLQLGVCRGRRMTTRINSCDQLPAENILKIKLALPQIRPDAVIRTRLLRRLTAGILQNALTLVSAPAGFGKTTLLSEWGRMVRADIPVAWITLDEGD